MGGPAGKPPDRARWLKHACLISFGNYFKLQCGEKQASDLQIELNTCRPGKCKSWQCGGLSLSIILCRFLWYKLFARLVFFIAQPQTT